MPETLSPEIVVAVGVCARIAAAVCTGTLPILPGGSFRIRISLAFALAVVAVPMALAVQAASPERSIGPLLPVLAGELFVGLMMGTAAAAVLAATAWAGGILGSVSGLSWADDFDPAAAGRSIWRSSASGCWHSPTSANQPTRSPAWPKPSGAGCSPCTPDTQSWPIPAAPVATALAHSTSRRRRRSWRRRRGCRWRSTATAR